MFPIVKKRVLNETVTLMEIEAPLVARKALPGQFIIFRIDEEGERIPLTIAGYDREKGTVTIIFQKVGYTTMKLDTLNECDALLDFVGPLGEPSHTEGVKRAAVIGGGLGVAIAYPQAKALHEAGCEVDLIVGFRNEHLIILKDELAAACTDLTIMTDDGSNGNKGFVTQALQAKLDAGKAYDEVIAIGPLPMMKAVCDLFLLPSNFEGSPVTLVEAQGCGVPCLASTNVPGDGSVTELVHFLPLSAPFEEWAKTADSIAPGGPHADYWPTLAAAGYELKTAAHRMEQVYDKVAGEGAR